LKSWQWDTIKEVLGLPLFVVIRSIKRKGLKRIHREGGGVHLTKSPHRKEFTSLNEKKKWVQSISGDRGKRDGLHMTPMSKERQGSTHLKEIPLRSGETRAF